MIGALMYWVLWVGVNLPRWIGWFRWRLEGRERLPPRERGGMVLVMNHINWLDIPVVGALLPYSYRLSWLAKSELFANPIVARWFRTMNVIPIRRGKRDLAAMDAAVEALKAGAVLLIFPEGTRSRDGVLQGGRGGAVRMAMRAGVPIVPLAIVGTEGGIKAAMRRHPVVLTVGKPYYVPPTPDGKIALDQMEQLTNEMMISIAALLPPERRGIYGPMLETPTG